MLRRSKHSTIEVVAPKEEEIDAFAKSYGDLHWSVTSRRRDFAYRKRGRNEDTERELFFVLISLKYKHNCTRHVKKIKKYRKQGTLTHWHRNFLLNFGTPCI
jgi:hypothetical protein